MASVLGPRARSGAFPREPPPAAKFSACFATAGPTWRGKDAPWRNHGSLTTHAPRWPTWRLWTVSGQSGRLTGPAARSCVHNLIILYHAKWANVRMSVRSTVARLRTHWMICGVPGARRDMLRMVTVTVTSVQRVMLVWLWMLHLVPSSAQRKDIKD